MAKQGGKKTNITPENGRRKLVRSLKIATQILSQCKANYRITGSVLLSACINKVYRKISDIDVFIDDLSLERVVQKFQKKGFQVITKSLLDWQIIHIIKRGYVPLEFKPGKFEKDYYRQGFWKSLECRVPTESVIPIQYNFDGIQFIGVPISFVIEGMKRTYFKPGRGKDLRIINKVIKGRKRNLTEKVDFYFSGIKIPFLFELYLFFYNLIGGLRVMFGKEYKHNKISK